MIKEVDEDQWAANHITKTLSVPGLRAGIYHKYENTGVAASINANFSICQP